MKRRYLLYFRKAVSYIGGSITLDEGDTPLSWDVIRVKFANLAKIKNSDHAMVTEWPEETPEGILVKEELSGRDGMHFTLFKPPSTDAIRLVQVQRRIRNERDATGFSIVRLQTILDLDALPPAELTTVALYTRQVLKASELIALLGTYIARHGDKDVEVRNPSGDIDNAKIAVPHHGRHGMTFRIETFNPEED